MGGTAAAYGVARASLAPENAAPPYFGHRRGSAALAAAASKPHANWPEACVLADGLWTTGCQVAICKKLREVAERNVDKHSEIRRKLEQDFERLQEEREAECAERKLLRQNELEEVAQRKEEAECAQLERELQYERDRKEQRRKELWRKELRRKELEEIAQRKQEKDEQERLQQMCEAKRRDERTGLGLLELLDGGAVQERLVQFIMREPEPEPELETEPEPETCPASHDMNCGPGCLICEGTCLVRRRAVPAGGAQAAVRKRAISVPVKAVVGLMLTNTTAQNALSTEFVWSWLCDEFWADKVFVPEQARELQRGRRSKEAFQFAVLDSTRACITMAELTARVWQTRVKPAAGAARMSGDAWQQGQPTSNAAVYNADGTGDMEAGHGFRPYAMFKRQFVWRFAHDSGDREGTYVQARPHGGAVPAWRPKRAIVRHPYNWVRMPAVIVVMRLHANHCAACPGLATRRSVIVVRILVDAAERRRRRDGGEQHTKQQQARYTVTYE